MSIDFSFYLLTSKFTRKMMLWTQRVWRCCCTDGISVLFNMSGTILYVKVKGESLPELIMLQDLLSNAESRRRTFAPSGSPRPHFREAVCGWASDQGRNCVKRAIKKCTFLVEIKISDPLSDYLFPICFTGDPSGIPPRPQCGWKDMLFPYLLKAAMPL